jgi:hypothetical protein
MSLFFRTDDGAAFPGICCFPTGEAVVVDLGSRGLLLAVLNNDAMRRQSQTGPDRIGSLSAA